MGLVIWWRQFQGSPAIQDMAWTLLSAFSQVYSENCEQKAEQKDLTSL
jgi:hypothetical protein